MMKHSYRKIQVFCLLLTFVFLNGCATIQGRQNREIPVSFTSNIPANITCSGKQITTPGKIALRQSKSHQCTATAPGYQTKNFRIQSNISDDGFEDSTESNTDSWGWMTLGIGTFVGWGVDYVSGSMRNLDKDSVYLEMQPLGEVSTSEKVLGKTVSVGKTLVNVPRDLVQNTTTAVMDTTLRGGAEQLGFTSDSKSDDEEKAEKEIGNMAESNSISETIQGSQTQGTESI